ncbi:MAG: phage tail protein [Clostridia bacterium]|nr:phage tail protein [Clostridia bacterium]
MIGSYGPIIFSVSDKKALTFSSLSRSAGSEWASHETLRGKKRSEYIGAALQAISLEITLSAMHGVRPRQTAETLVQMAEDGAVYSFVVGGKPIGNNLWKLVSVSDDWKRIYSKGEVSEITVSLSLEEYV